MLNTTLDDASRPRRTLGFTLLGWTILAIVGLAAARTAPAELLRFDLPEYDLTRTPGGFFAEYAAPAVGHVRHAAWRLVFDTGDTFDAAKLRLHVEAPTTDLPTWEVTGAGLGWSGQGHFEAEIATNQLNGRFIGDDQTFFTFLSITLGTTDGSELGGRFTSSALLLDYVPFTRLEATTDPVRAGEPATFHARGLRLALIDTTAYLVASMRRGLTFAPPLFIHADLASPVVLGTAEPDANGEATWTVDVPAGLAGRTVWVQSLQAFHKSNRLEVRVE